MPFDLPLPGVLHRQGWKVKILDREALEEPHATICFRTRKWRFGLRSRRFLDTRPDPGEVSSGVRQALDEHLDRLVEEGNQRYPSNPV